MSEHADILMELASCASSDGIVDGARATELVAAADHIHRLEARVMQLEAMNQRSGCPCPVVHRNSCQIGPNAMAQRASIKSPYR